VIQGEDSSNCNSFTLTPPYPLQSQAVAFSAGWNEGFCLALHLSRRHQVVVMLQKAWADFAHQRLTSGQI
jgi:hypothetical protein